MAASNMNIRMDAEVKAQAQAIFAQFGLDMTTAINMYLRQVIRERGIPFELRLAPSVDDLTANWTPEHWKKVRAMLTESEADAAAGRVSDAFEDLAELRARHGL